jgi:hypothetical protein
MTHLQAVRTTLEPQQNAYTQLTTYFESAGSSVSRLDTPPLAGIA